ncbi:MAG: peptidylprolyl isomerase [Gammaproteobacteria bacterium]|jgi:FKBP-type peptidyl-prolyl cis-trans isomerase SlyD|nr:peptidylprolyl isomerase [Gammaproteobacteria bacterium]
MQIAKHKVVTLDYTLTDKDGNVLDQSQGGEFTYLHGAKNIIPGLENALDGKKSGDEVKVSVAPDDGYGQRNDALTQVVPKDAFESNDEIQVGQQFHAQTPEGQYVMITVMNVEGDQITIDGNHPLAGVDLNFDVKVVDVRDATDEEVSHGHVHGPEGHQH